MKISVEEANIKTAQVEVKVMSLGGKQVTLAVFRQLEQEDVFDYDLNYKGDVWGRVNYHPDKCGESDRKLNEHIHYVWQKGGELRRGVLYQNQPNKIKKIENTQQVIIEKQHLRSKAVSAIDLYNEKLTDQDLKEIHKLLSKISAEDWSQAEHLMSLPVEIEETDDNRFNRFITKATPNMRYVYPKIASLNSVSKWLGANPSLNSVKNKSDRIINSIEEYFRFNEEKKNEISAFVDLNNLFKKRIEEILLTDHLFIAV